MRKISHILIVVAATLLSENSFAKKNSDNGGTPPPPPTGGLPRGVQAADCSPPTAQSDLDVNNVRATILMADMWWDLNTARYEVPKGSKKHSLFAGSLWIGGVDAGNQLKVAAQTYRQDGADFWPGPLKLSDASIEAKTCADYDRHYKITLREVEDFYAWNQDKSSNPEFVIPKSILDWPGNGNTALGQTQFLAPFTDQNGDGIYDPNDGDYPAYDVTGSGNCDDKIFGDQTLWWVFNDKGNIHTETGGVAIGLEIHAQAFGFQTNDEINNMTFYTYKIFNRSTTTLNNTYFAQWDDADLGQYDDDYVGCDVRRGLGYCYNGKDVDGTGGPGSYGENPPAVGVDFFQGPISDPNDGRDNDRDGVVDEDDDTLTPGYQPEQIIMSKFVYYNNDFTDIGNPENATHYYNYLQGIWKDGTQMTYGGNGHLGAQPTDFMFPGDTDPASGPEWSETSAGNVPADRRFLHSAGSFTLQPGAVNRITIGAVWARATQGGPLASVELLKVADDKAQALFDNCFQVLNGPDAPDITIRELDRELLMFLSNKKTSNNYNEKYEELDPTIVTPAGVTPPYDRTYNFEGYLIYQLKDAEVSNTEFNNPDRARLVAQVDLQNGISTIINYKFDPALGASVPFQEVAGADKGISHSFRITDDLFAQGDKRLVNHKSYYYKAITYGFNEYKKYKQDDPASVDGQKLPFKAGRRNIRTAVGIPHIPAMESNGTIAHSVYGDMPQLTRVEGQGNGGYAIDFTPETEASVVSNGFVANVVYETGKGPIEVKVIDPLSVPPGDFQFKLIDTLLVPANELKDAYWTLTNTSTGEVINSDQTIEVNNEQLITKWGISVNVKQVAADPGLANSINNGFIEGSISFADPKKEWMGFLPDFDNFGPYNWIRAGVAVDDPATANANEGDYANQDNKEVYEGVIDGTWAPYRLASYENGGPAHQATISFSTLKNLASVNIVITADRSKWTRCPVLETQQDSLFAVGRAKKLNLRETPSVDKDGNPDNSGTTGMGWFPGYAVNIETGERLNMAFGEDSYLASENGADMKWNPSPNVNVPSNPFDVLFGGKHFIYVFGHNGDTKYPATDIRLPNKLKDVPRYDEGKMIYEGLKVSASIPSTTYKRNIVKDLMWVGIPILGPNNSLFETDVTIKLRVAKPFRKYYAATDSINGSTSPVNKNLPMYTFSLNDLAVETGNAEAAKNALDLINVVPNPYYAYSNYEKTQLDNVVKITNLPQKCVISIYTLNGTLIRTFNKDASITSQDWDLKNSANIPIASGAYIIHVNVEGVGEKVIKWFGVLRPIDLDTF